MYFTLSPFFYYLVHQQNIKHFVAINTNGEMSYQLSGSVLKSLVNTYIELNGHNISQDKKNNYIEYIVEKLHYGISME